MKPNAKYRNTLLAKVHIAKTQLGMDDETYRANLAHYGNGKTTSKDLSVPQLTAMLSAFEHLGFKAKPAKPKQGQPNTSSITLPKDERSVIMAIWREMHSAGFIKDGTDIGLNEWVKRQTAAMNQGEGVANVAWLEPRMAVSVLESLKQWYRRLMYSDLQAKGHTVWPQMSYLQVLKKWEQVNGVSA